MAFDHAETNFSPFNMADSTLNASAAALQANWMDAEQAVVQVAGVGGDGENENIADNGSPALKSRQDLVPVGNASSTAGNGGDGIFAGSLVHSSLAVYDPINIAVAGSNAHAIADQTNTAVIDQSAIQIAGGGGHGGTGNTSSPGPGDAFTAGHSASDPLDTRLDGAGNGGNRNLCGSLVNTSLVFYNPVNIAIAGHGAHARADQTNDVNIEQHDHSDSRSWGPRRKRQFCARSRHETALLRLIGSDVVGFEPNSAGTGGDGYFIGSSADIDVVVYAPVNIAVAGYHSTADAHQSNIATIDQSASHVEPGIGGHGGDGNHVQPAETGYPTFWTQGIS